MKRIVGLVGLYKRQHFEDKETGNEIVNKLAGMVEAMPVKQRTYELTSAPMLNRLAKRADSLLDKATPALGRRPDRQHRFGPQEIGRRVSNERRRRRWTRSRCSSRS